MSQRLPEVIDPINIPGLHDVVVDRFHCGIRVRVFDVAESCHTSIVHQPRYCASAEVFCLTPEILELLERDRVMEHLKQAFAVLSDILIERPEVMSPVTELDLLRRITSGDQQAFTLVYREWKGPIYRFAWHMCGNVPVAEEVMQD